MRAVPKIGSVVFATEQGLGILAKKFYDAGVINKVLIKGHSRHKDHYEWYGDNWQSFNETNYDWFLDGLDVLLFFETPFDWKLIPMARERGIATFLMPDECTPYPLKYEPDVIVCPSALEREYNKGRRLMDIVVPADVPWKLRTKARTFIHNAGHGGLGGRNGTKELIEAMRHVKSPLKLVIRSQTEQFSANDPRIEIRHGSVPHSELWVSGDVLVFPDKFAGLSLPMQEAFAAGMLLMTTDRFPNNVWLPKEPLIPVRSYKRGQLGIQFDMADINPVDIGTTMDVWYNQDITKFSRLGKAWAKRNTWQNVKDALSSQVLQVNQDRT